MTAHSRCTEIRALLGVYVLGAIDPAERALVDAHLADCRRCRDELAGMAGLPALLGRVTEEQITQVGAAPPELLESVLGRAAVEQRVRSRRGRRWLAAAAAVAVITGGAGVASGLRLGADRPVAAPTRTATAPPGPAVHGRTVRGSDPATGVSAQISMWPQDWGTAFQVRLTGAPTGARCRLIAVDGKGRRDVAAAWQVEYEGSADFSGSSMIPRDRITSVEVRTVEGRRLLSVPV
jgi:Putative zinc-finger